MSGTPPHTAAETPAERIGNGVVRGPFHERESSPQEIAETIILTKPFLNGSLTPNRVFPSSPPLPIHTSEEDSNSGILLDPNLSAAPPSSPNSPSENSSIQSEDDMLSSYSGNSRNSAEAGKVKSSTSTSTRTYHATVEEYDSANSSIIEEVIEEKNEDETIIKTENDDDEITFRQESEDEENDNPCFVPVPCDNEFGFKPYKAIHSAESRVGGQVVHRRVSNGTSRNNEQYKTDNHSDRSTDTDVGGVQLNHQQVDNDGTSRDNSPEPPMQTQDDIIRFVNGSQCSLAKLSERALIEFLRENDLDGPVKRICPYITVNKCMRINDSKEPCKDKTHFYRRTNQVYNVKLGDCSYLSGCYNYDTCPFVHYSTKPAVQPKTVFEAIKDKIPEHLDETVKKHGNGDMYTGLKEIQAKIKSEEKGKVSIEDYPGL